MALTLAATISASDVTLQVAGGDVVSAGFRFRLDDELLDVSGFEPYSVVAGKRKHGVDPSRWIVNRAQGESIAASHSAGASIVAAVSASLASANLTKPDPFVDPADAGLSADELAAIQGAASPSASNVFATMADVGGSPVLLGPYTVNWNTAGIDDPGVGVGSVLPTGTVILDMRAVCPDTSFDGTASGGRSAFLGLGVTGLDAVATYLFDSGSGYPIQSNSGYTVPIAESSVGDPVDPSFQRKWLISTANQKLWVQLAFTPSSQGSMNVYALVLYP